LGKLASLLPSAVKSTFLASLLLRGVTFFCSGKKVRESPEFIPPFQTVLSSSISQGVVEQGR
jgi:hypothetical protein